MLIMNLHGLELPRIVCLFSRFHGLLWFILILLDSGYGPKSVHHQILCKVQEE